MQHYLDGNDNLARALTDTAYADQLNASKSAIRVDGLGWLPAPDTLQNIEIQGLNANFNLRNEIDTVLREHPQLAETTVFVNALEAARDGKVTFIGSDVMKARIADFDGLVDEHCLNEARSLVEHTNSEAVALAHDIKAVIYNPRSGDNLFESSFLKPDNKVAQAYIFDHEVGHLLLKHGITGEGALVEASADAYAAIRSIQRFGGPEAIADMAMGVRAFNSVRSGDGYLNTTVIDEIIQESKRTDFSKLSAAETVELAEKFAAMHAPRADERLEAKETYSMSTARSRPRWRPISPRPASRPTASSPSIPAHARRRRFSRARRTRRKAASCWTACVNAPRISG